MARRLPQAGVSGMIDATADREPIVASEADRAQLGALDRLLEVDESADLTSPPLTAEDIIEELAQFTPGLARLLINQRRNATGAV